MVWVPGVPRPKGSMICRGPRACPKCGCTIIHPVTADGPADSKAWVEKLTLAGRMLRTRLGFTFEGPVSMEATFILPRPATAAKRMYPHHRPDVDKLGRMLLDPLQVARAFDNDGQVVDLALHKRYTTPDHPDPGVRFTVNETVNPDAPTLIGLP